MARFANLFKCLILALAMSVAGIASADTVIVNVSNKASPATVFANALKDAIPDSRVYHASSCEDGLKKFNKTQGALLVYNSSIDFSNRRTGDECRQPAAPALVLAKQYMKVCTANAASFGRGRVLMGMASMYSTKAHEADLNRNGADVRLIPFAGSKDILAAVLNGDIDFGYLGGSMATTPGLVCHFSTNAKDKDFIGSKMKLKVPDFRINMVVYGNGSLGGATPAANSQAFADFMRRGAYEATWYPKASELREVEKFVDNLYRFYK